MGIGITVKASLNTESVEEAKQVFIDNIADLKLYPILRIKKVEPYFNIQMMP